MKYDDAEETIFCKIDDIFFRKLLRRPWFWSNPFPPFVQPVTDFCVQ